jgi:hypothetical protein
MKWVSGSRSDDAMQSDVPVVVHIVVLPGGVMGPSSRNTIGPRVTPSFFADEFVGTPRTRGRPRPEPAPGAHRDPTGTV